MRNTIIEGLEIAAEVACFLMVTFVMLSAVVFSAVILWG